MASELEHLSEDDEQWIATELLRQLETMRKDPRRVAWAYALIDDLLWFWTADAVHPDGKIRRDAIKTDPRFHSTDAARRSLDDGFSLKEDKVQHEHAGERAEIIAALKANAHTVAKVLEIVRHLNVAVLVTRREHKALGKRHWPEAWHERQWRRRYDDLEMALREPTVTARRAIAAR
jgi:hypothetical protein